MAFSCLEVPDLAPVEVLDLSDLMGWRLSSQRPLNLLCVSAVSISNLWRCVLLPADLPEAEKLALSLCCHHDRPTAWKTIFFECLSSGKHFLEQVLVSHLKRTKAR